MIPEIYDNRYLVDRVAGNTPTRLCYVGDAISCRITEDLDHTYKLDMVIPATSPAYQYMVEDYFIVVHWIVPEVSVASIERDTRIFYIDKVTKKSDMRVEINALHVSYRMADIVVGRYVAGMGGTPTVYGENPFTVILGSDIQTLPTIYHELPCSFRDTLWGMEGSLVDQTHYELVFEDLDVHVLTQRGEDSGVHVRYGKDLTDYQQEQYLSDYYTHAFLYWTKQDENGGDMEYVEANDIIQLGGSYNAPTNRIKIVDVSSEFDTKPTAVRLLQWGFQNREKWRDEPKVHIKVSFLNAAGTTKDDILREYGYYDCARLSLGDRVTVDFDRLGVSATARIVRTVFDVIEERYVEMELGNAKPKLYKTLAKLIKKTGVNINE